MAKRKKSKKSSGNKEEWTEEQYEEYLAELYDMEFIAGYTEGGMPYGTFINEDKKKEKEKTENIDICSNTFEDDYLPF